jgi:hypothetical protein
VQTSSKHVMRCEYFFTYVQVSLWPTKKIIPDEEMIPWQGSSTFRIYNPRKINKYGMLV